MKNFYEQAEEVLNRLDANPSSPTRREGLLKAAAYLQQASRRREGPRGRATGRLAMVTIELNELPRAAALAQQALLEDQHSVYGRTALFALACARYESHNPYIHSDTSSLGGFVFMVGTLGMAGVGKIERRNEVLVRAREVAEAFVQTTRNDQEKNVADWISLAEVVLFVADCARQYGLKDPRIYRAILDAPWHEAQLGCYAEQVIEIRSRAEGLSYL